MSPSRGTTPQPQARTTVPAVTVGQSFAYGARGKAELKSQVAKGSTSIDSAFEGARNRKSSAKTPSRAPPGPEAIDEEDESEDEQLFDQQQEQDSLRSPITRRQPRTSRPADQSQNPFRQTSTQATDPEEEFEQFARDQMRPRSQQSTATSRPPTASSARLDGTEFDRSHTVVDPAARYGNDRDESPQEPNNVRVAAGTALKFLPAYLWNLILMAIMVAGCLAVGFLCYNGFRTTFTPVVPTELEEFTTRLGALWIHYRMRTLELDQIPLENWTQYDIDSRQIVQINSLLERATDLEETVALHEKSLRALDDILPPRLVVREVDGQVEIPQQFWEALLQKFSGEEAAPLWQSFLTKNEDSVRQLANAAVESRMSDSTEMRRIVSADLFRDLLDENFGYLNQHFNELLVDAERRMLTRLRDEMEKTAQGVVEKTLRSNALHSVNFLSPALGARVNPHETSSTYYPPRKGLFGGSAYLSGVRSPIEALSKWDEPGECWCAANSTAKGKGQAQITVHLGEKIWPGWLTIEHMPADGTLHIDAAPRDWELWLPARDKQHAQETTRILREDFIHCTGTPPSDKHVCVATGRYDIHGSNWVQSFTLYGERLEELGFATDKVTFRVNTNWGADHTCIYRLRLTGDRVVVS
ncbi:hypothetical protein BTJ68_06247 [Hortaea werneckii EXF-2000]|uniref:SUN domain-containing protein n=1 Tax=Hortaea werneckii EXF-2000 TaxID=1157616 RepID=A0A1Z5T9C7_HORWE|nr:hypothetical protein BTJ68_06247 [Hortaea werneckii EXF-2000]